MKVDSLSYILPQTVCVCLHSNFSGELCKTISFRRGGPFGRSRSSKVTDIGANRKRVCDFLLVRNSNFGPILHHFQAKRRFMCYLPHPYSTLILGVFPLHQIAHVGRQPEQRGVPVAPDRPCWASARAEALSYLAVKLFSKNSNLCVADT